MKQSSGKWPLTVNACSCHSGRQINNNKFCQWVSYVYNTSPWRRPEHKEGNIRLWATAQFQSCLPVTQSSLRIPHWFLDKAINFRPFLWTLNHWDDRWETSWNSKDVVQNSFEEQLKVKLNSVLFTYCILMTNSKRKGFHSPLGLTGPTNFNSHTPMTRPSHLYSFTPYSYCMLLP